MCMSQSVTASVNILEAMSSSSKYVVRTLRKASLVCQSSCVRRKRGSKPSRKSLLTSGILSGELHDSCEKSPSFGFFDVDEFFIILDFTEKIFSQFFCLFVVDFRPGSGSMKMTDQWHLLWKIRLMNFGLLKLGLEWRRNFLDVVSSKVIKLYLP